MSIWGINALNHGSSLAVFEGSDLRLKHWEFCQTDELDKSIINRAINNSGPDTVFWYENPWVKKTRQLYARQYDSATDLSVLPRDRKSVV